MWNWDDFYYFGSREEIDKNGEKIYIVEIRNRRGEKREHIFHDEKKAVGYARMMMD